MNVDISFCSAKAEHNATENNNNVRHLPATFPVSDSLDSLSLEFSVDQDEISEFSDDGDKDYFPSAESEMESESSIETNNERVEFDFLKQNHCIVQLEHNRNSNCIVQLEHNRNSNVSLNSELEVKNRMEDESEECNKDVFHTNEMVADSLSEHSTENLEIEQFQYSVDNADCSTEIPFQGMEKSIIMQQKTSLKLHSCLFCGMLYSKLPRHFEYVHQSEKKVIEALLLPKGSSERKQAFLYLQNKGDYNHNISVLEKGHGILIPKYRSRDGEERNNMDYLPCEFCFGLYVKSDLAKHQKKCKKAVPKPKGKAKPILNARLLLPTRLGSKELHVDILNKMKDDEIKRKVMNDRLILEFGNRLHEKSGHEGHRHHEISQRLRELGRLIISFKEMNTKIYCLEQCFLPKNWELLLSAVKNVAGFCKESGKYDIPTLPVKLGHSLSKCAKVLRTKAIMEDNEDVKKSVEGFLKLYEDEWNERISVKARQTLYTAKFNKPLLLPMVEDVVLLHNFLQRRIGQVKESSLDGGAKYRELAELLLTQIILFNRRRSGEAQRIKVKDIGILDNQSKPNHEIMNCLSPLEQELCNSHERIEIQGKRGNKVPVLFTKEMMISMKYLISCRASANIESEYIFGKQDSSQPLRGSDCLRKFSKACGAKHPENITSTKLRKQLATLTQVLGLSEVGQDILAKFMGHDIRVHRQFYRLSDDSLQLAKVTKILHCINSGKLAEVKGKDFDEISFNENEKVEEESDEEDSSEDEYVDSGNSNDSINDDKLTVTWESKRQSIGGRKMWSKEEQEAAKRQLSKYLKEKSLPGKKACEEAKRNENVLSSRTWIQIKNFIRNQNLKGNKYWSFM